MSLSTLVPPIVSKEIRALFPLWLGCVAVAWLGGFATRYVVPAGFLALLLGSAALGALAFGHEYTNRTLGLLLASPVSRRRIFAAKAGVLVVMLVTLGIVALARLPTVPAGREMHDTTRVGLVSLVGSLFLAPWLTMVCRNPIAGGLFGLSISSALLIGSELVTQISGLDPAHITLLDSGEFNLYRIDLEVAEAHPALPRGNVCVPGCGTGHDVREWAKAGFNAFGFDVAPSAFKRSINGGVSAISGRRKRACRCCLSA